MRRIYRVGGTIYRVGGVGGIGLVPPLPTFYAGSVTGSPRFSFGVVVDEPRGYAYAMQTNGEDGPVARIDLRSGRIDTMPLTAAYGLPYRHSDGSLYCYDHRIVTPPLPAPGSYLRRFQPAAWSPGDATVPALNTASTMVSSNAEFGAYLPALDAVLIPRRGGIDAWDANTLTPTAYASNPMPYGVHGMRWDGGKLWWVEGDQSSGKRWHVGGTTYATLPVGSATDMIPFPELGRVAIIGYPYAGRGCWIFDETTGALLQSLAGFGSSAIGGTFRDPASTDRFILFDLSEASIRVVSIMDGSTQESIPLDSRRFGTGFGLRGRRIALPFSGAGWGDENCGILVF